MPDHADGPLHVLERVVAFPFHPLRHAILQHDAGDADRIEPFGDFGPFLVEGQNVVAAAGANDDRRRWPYWPPAGRSSGSGPETFPSRIVVSFGRAGWAASGGRSPFRRARRPARDGFAPLGRAREKVVNAAAAKTEHNFRTGRQRMGRSSSRRSWFRSETGRNSGGVILSCCRADCTRRGADR